MRTKATVVDISLPLASSANLANAGAAGVSRASPFATRAGRYPPSFSRRACRYAISGDSRGGRTNSHASHCASVSGSAKRSRKAMSWSVSSFFCWCVVIRPCPAVPMPKPFLVFARITVGWPVWRAACQ